MPCRYCNRVALAIQPHLGTVEFKNEIDFDSCWIVVTCLFTGHEKEWSNKGCCNKIRFHERNFA